MKNYLETISQIIFLGLFSCLVILVSLGIEQDFTALRTVTFWTEVLMRLCTTITLFNIIYYMDKRNKMHDTKSRFFRAYATNRLKIKEIESKRLYEPLERAVRTENHELLKEHCNFLLHKLCTRISYDDILDDKDIDELLSEFRVLPKRRKKLAKLITCIRAGGIKIRHPLKVDFFLNDKELANLKPSEYDYSELTLSLRRNFRKAFTFLICSIILATFSFTLTSAQFWTAFVTNFTLLLGAMVSGFASSYRDVKLKTAIYERRNQFLLKHLELKIEYTGEQA